MVKENEYADINDVDLGKLIKVLTEESTVRRAKTGISQGELSNIIGVSR